MTDELSTADDNNSRKPFFSQKRVKLTFLCIILAIVGVTASVYDIMSNSSPPVDLSTVSLSLTERDRILVAASANSTVRSSFLHDISVKDIECTLVYNEARLGTIYATVNGAKSLTSSSTPIDMDVSFEKINFLSLRSMLRNGLKIAVSKAADFSDFSVGYTCDMEGEARIFKFISLVKRFEVKGVVDIGDYVNYPTLNGDESSGGGVKWVKKDPRTTRKHPNPSPRDDDQFVKILSSMERVLSEVVKTVSTTKQGESDI